MGLWLWQKGIRTMNVLEFYDKATDREMGLVIRDHHIGWLVYKHPDGQWVTYRQATDDDMKRIIENIGWPAEDADEAVAL